MRKISASVKEAILADDYYLRCARMKEGDCNGHITWEHALIYAGRQVDEKWAIIPLCEWHHAVNKHQGGGNENKEKHQWIALKRATKEELAKYPKTDWEQKLKYLNDKYNN